MPVPPWVSWYPSDWIASVRVSVMSIAQEGAYHRLLCFAWLAEDCSLPTNLVELMQLAKWVDGPDLFQPILACFAPHPTLPDRLCNLRLLAERQKLTARHRANQQAAKIRWELVKEKKNQRLRRQPTVTGPLPFPDDFQIQDKHRVLAQQWQLDVGYEFGKFKNYCLAHNKRYADYTAAFRNWLSNAYERRTP